MVSWNNALSDKGYKLPVQFENRGIEPGICVTSELNNFSKSGSRTFNFSVPADAPLRNDYRFLAVFMSKDKAWEDTKNLTAALKTIEVEN